ncbi:MAG: hypothetical protein FWG04_04675 [Desulfovibrionaceae bacterium]|nr:hypothetical protein [Desulfovibrionaceae bacterium]
MAALFNSLKREQEAYSLFNYGQGSADTAFNPSSRDPVYQQVSRARSDQDFARFFAWDILTAKPGSGDYLYSASDGQASSSAQTHTANKYRQNGGGAAPEYAAAREISAGGKGNYLNTKHQLNAANSWVAQAFGAPAMKDADGAWRLAMRFGSDTSGGQSWSGRDFTPGEAVTDKNAVRLLNEGHYAFSAKGERGTEIFIPWAEGYTPGKGQREAKEMKKKAQTGSGAERTVVGIGGASPGNVIGGRASLLGTAEDSGRRRSLLG